LLLGCIAFAACEEDSDYGPYSVGEQDTTIGVSFDIANVSVSDSRTGDEELTVTFGVNRKDASQAVTVPIIVNSTDSIDGAPAFEIPSSVSFAAGSTKTNLTITFPNAVLGNTYSFDIEIPEEYQNTYANHQLLYSVLYDYNWTSYKGSITDSFLGFTADVTVQHAEGTNIWRVVKPFAQYCEDNEYEYDYNGLAEKIVFEVNEDGSVTFTTFASDYYDESHVIYAFWPTDLSASLEEYNSYSGVYDAQTVFLYPYYYVPGLGGWGASAFVIELEKGTFGDFPDAEEEGEGEEGGDAENGSEAEDGGEANAEGEE
jgi:hypothetical protein